MFSNNHPYLLMKAFHFYLLTPHMLDTDQVFLCVCCSIKFAIILLLVKKMTHTKVQNADLLYPLGVFFWHDWYQDQ